VLANEITPKGHGEDDHGQNFDQEEIDATDTSLTADPAASMDHHTLVFCQNREQP